MPTYEYECKSCSHNFEVFQSMSDPPLTKCPECGREVRRLIFGGTGVIFKGSGFYVTDKSSENRKAAEKTKPAEPASGDASKGGTGKTDTAKAESNSSVPKNSSSGEKTKPESKSA